MSAAKVGQKRPLEGEDEDVPDKVQKMEECEDVEDGGESKADALSPEPTPITKSGRVRKKSAKVLEMEEAEEMERIVSRLPKATAKSAKKPKKEAAVPVATPGGTATIKTLLNAAAKPAIQRENSLEALQAQLSMGGFLTDPPPPPSSQEAPTAKKSKAKKVTMAPSVPLPTSPPAAASVVEVKPEEEEPGMRLKMLLSPTREEVSAAVASGSVKIEEPLSPPPSKKKKSRKQDVVKVETVPELPLQTEENIVLFEDPEESITSDTALELSTAESASDVDVDAPLVIDTVAPPPSKKKKAKKTKKEGKAKMEVASPPAYDQAVLQQQSGDRSGEGPSGVSGDMPPPVYANTQQMGMKLMTSAEKKASKKKGKKAKKEEDPEKPKKKRAPTAYMLWCNSYRSKVVSENPGIDFAQISRRLGEIWQSLPEKEKLAWKRKAKKAANKGSTLISTGKAGASRATAAAPGSSPPASKTSPSTSQSKAADGASEVAAAEPGTSSGQAAARTAIDTPDLYMYKVVGTSPVDAAAHLKLLGESLTIIGARLQEHQGQIAVQGSLSVLLDSLLCALGPLVCLTNQLPELDGCPSSVQSSTLDNIAYFMPGIG